MISQARIKVSAVRLQGDVWPCGKPSVLLADDHAIIADGLRRLLEPECEVVGIVSDGYALIETARETRPDIVLVDITMPLLNGIDATVQLLRDLPETHVIFLTMHADRAYATEAFEAGAAGFVVKHAAPDELWQAINTVLLGGAYMSPRVGGTGAMTKRRRATSTPGVASFHLTTRQRQVLQLVAEGHSTKSIGLRLRLAPKTVEFHKYRAMKGLGLNSSAQLIQFALKHGLTS